MKKLECYIDERPINSTGYALKRGTVMWRLHTVVLLSCIYCVVNVTGYAERVL